MAEWVTLTEASKRTGISRSTLKWNCSQPQGFFAATHRQIQIPGQVKAVYQIPLGELRKFAKTRLPKGQ